MESLTNCILNQSRNCCGEPAVAASGIPADDFAIDRKGSVYLTTHIYNTIVRVDPNGRRTVITTATQGIFGTTDCVFGSGPDDQGTLYTVTDGGALVSGDAQARGTLVSIKLPDLQPQPTDPLPLSTDRP